MGVSPPKMEMTLGVPTLAHVKGVGPVMDTEPPVHVPLMPPSQTGHEPPVARPQVHALQARVSTSPP
jgi:hypothetical protein